MQDNTLHIKEEESIIHVELEVSPKTIWVQGMTFFMFLMTSFTTLLFLISMLMASRSDFEFSFLLGIVLTALVAWYFLKLYLWNRGGKEIFIIGKNKIEYYSDYKLFKQNRKIYPYDDFHLIYWDTDGTIKDEDGNLLDDIAADGYAILGFELDTGKIIDTTVELPFHELRRLGDVLNLKQIKKKIKA